MSDEDENFSIFSMQVAVALCAVEALVINHPEPEKVRASFDLLFGQIHAAFATTGMAKQESNFLRDLVETLFSRQGTTPQPFWDRSWSVSSNRFCVG